MKRTLVLCSVLGLLILSVPLAWANQCPKLIKQGNELLAKANLSENRANKIKALLDEAQKLHGTGSHGDSVKKANEALDLLKK